MDEKSVFINCPFDNEYFRLLKPLLFTVIYLKLTPIIAETNDSGVERLHKIKSLMQSAKYSIHDLSRINIVNNNELPRLNMAFECGVDFGLRYSGCNNYSEKLFLILAKDRESNSRAISDISGYDAKYHNYNTESLIKAVRDWFSCSMKKLPFATEIYQHYQEFEFIYNNKLSKLKYNPHDINSIPFSDVIELINDWIDEIKA